MRWERSGVGTIAQCTKCFVTVVFVITLSAIGVRGTVPRVIIVCDGSSSMCIASVDSADSRIFLARELIEALGRNCPGAQAQVVRYRMNDLGYTVWSGMATLSGDSAPPELLSTLAYAGCSTRRIGKTGQAQAGYPLLRALVLADDDYAEIGDQISRSIVILTDARFDDPDIMGAGKILTMYRRDLPGRELPVIHTVIYGDSAAGIDQYGMLADTTGGSLIMRSRVANDTMVLAQLLAAMGCETANSAVRHHNSSPLERSASNGLRLREWYAANGRAVDHCPFPVVNVRGTRLFVDGLPILPLQPDHAGQHRR